MIENFLRNTKIPGSVLFFATIFSFMFIFDINKIQNTFLLFTVIGTIVTLLLVFDPIKDFVIRLTKSYLKVSYLTDHLDYTDYFEVKTTKPFLDDLVSKLYLILGLTLTLMFVITQSITGTGIGLSSYSDELMNNLRINVITYVVILLLIFWYLGRLIELGKYIYSTSKSKLYRRINSSNLSHSMKEAETNSKNQQSDAKTETNSKNQQFDTTTENNQTLTQQVKEVWKHNIVTIPSIVILYYLFVRLLNFGLMILEKFLDIDNVNYLILLFLLFFIIQGIFSFRLRLIKYVKAIQYTVVLRTIEKPRDIGFSWITNSLRRRRILEEFWSIDETKLTSLIKALEEEDQEIYKVKIDRDIYYNGTRLVSQILRSMFKPIVKEGVISHTAQVEYFITPKNTINEIDDQSTNLLDEYFKDLHRVNDRLVERDFLLILESGIHHTNQEYYTVVTELNKLLEITLNQTNQALITHYQEFQNRISNDQKILFGFPTIRNYFQRSNKDLYSKLEEVRKKILRDTKSQNQELEIDFEIYKKIDIVSNFKVGIIRIIEYIIDELNTKQKEKTQVILKFEYSLKNDVVTPSDDDIQLELKEITVRSNRYKSGPKTIDQKDICQLIINKLLEKNIQKLSMTEMWVAYFKNADRGLIHPQDQLLSFNAIFGVMDNKDEILGSSYYKSIETTLLNHKYERKEPEKSDKKGIDDRSITSKEFWKVIQKIDQQLDEINQYVTNSKLVDLIK